jgi:GNAT superfamily N-acetyltransferase
VVACDGDRVVGTGLMIGDGVSFFYLKDVMVFPEYQGQGIGKAIVGALMDYLRREAPDRSLIGLFTRKDLAEFYEQYGFLGPEEGLFGMSYRKRNNPTTRLQDPK